MRIRILGAGIIGLSVADELLRRGHDVHLVDPHPGSGASYAAAGMLSPSAEVWYGEHAIIGLGLRSLEEWPAYADRLGVALHRTGTLLVARDRGDLQQIERQAALLDGHGRPGELLAAAATRRLEPALSPRVAGGLHLPEDHSVDPRAVVAALLDRLGDRLGDRVVPAAGAPYDRTVVATGARLPEPWTDLVRGVRGEILRAHTDDPPRHTVRGWVYGEPVYVVPRTGGEVVIGATSEEHDDPPEVTLGGITRLLVAARELLPGLDRARFGDAVARDRPGTPDNLPLVGPAPGDPDTVLAAGLYRHGVLLAPLVARLVADQLESPEPTDAVEPDLDPRRLHAFVTHHQGGDPC